MRVTRHAGKAFELEMLEPRMKDFGLNPEEYWWYLDLRRFGGSALTDEIEVPKSGIGDDIPVTYVPARNLIFLSLTLGWAEPLGALFVPGIRDIEGRDGAGLAARAARTT